MRMFLFLGIYLVLFFVCLQVQGENMWGRGGIDFRDFDLAGWGLGGGENQYFLGGLDIGGFYIVQ